MFLTKSCHQWQHKLNVCMKTKIYGIYELPLEATASLVQLGMGPGGQPWQLGLEAPLMVNIGNLAQEHPLVADF